MTASSIPAARRPFHIDRYLVIATLLALFIIASAVVVVIPGFINLGHYTETGNYAHYKVSDIDSKVKAGQPLTQALYDASGKAQNAGQTLETSAAVAGVDDYTLRVQESDGFSVTYDSRSGKYDSSGEWDYLPWNH